LRKILLMMALAFAANSAVAVPSGTGPAKAGKVGTQPRGNRLVVDSLPFAHSTAIPADTRLVNSGKVLELLDTDMYTYLQVTTVKGPLWIAAYKTNVAKGATVKYSNGVAMSNFFSNALNRHFEVIVFVDSLEQVKK